MPEIKQLKLPTDWTSADIYKTPGAARHGKAGRMNAGNPLGYDYRDPRHVERYGKLVTRHPDSETEGKHPRDADPVVLLEPIRAWTMSRSAD